MRTLSIERMIDAPTGRAPFGKLSFLTRLSARADLSRTGEGTRNLLCNRIAALDREFQKPTKEGWRVPRQPPPIRSAKPMAAIRLRPGRAWTNRLRFA